MIQDKSHTKRLKIQERNQNFRTPTQIPRKVKKINRHNVSRKITEVAVLFSYQWLQKVRSVSESFNTKQFYPVAVALCT